MYSHRYIVTQLNKQYNRLSTNINIKNMFTIYMYEEYILFVIMFIKINNTASPNNVD